MALRACYRCELLFEIDEEAGGASATCPQCGGPLEHYEPDEPEPPDESEVGAPTVIGEAAGVNPALLRTMSATNFPAQVREQILRGEVSIGAHEATLAPLMPVGGQASPVAAYPGAIPAPTPQSPPLQPFGQRSSTPSPEQSSPGSHAMQEQRAGRTRVLPVVGDPAQLAKLLDLPEPAPPPAAQTPTPAGPVPPPSVSAFGSPGAVAPAQIFGGVAPGPVDPSQVFAGQAPAQSALISSGYPAVPGGGRGQAKKGGAKPLVALLVIGLLGGGGFAAWKFLGDQPKPPEKPAASETPAEPKGWAAQIERMLLDAQGRLPILSGIAEAQAEGPFVAGGPEGFGTSVGPIHGMPRMEITNKGILDTDAQGAWVKPLTAALERGKVRPTEALGFAVDGGMKMEDLMRLVYAGAKHGHQNFNLLVARPEGSLGALPFKLKLGDDKLDPDTPVLVVRVGQIGFRVVVEKAGAVISQGDHQVPRKANQSLDFRGLSERVGELVGEHEGLKQVVIYSLPELKYADFTEVLAAIRGTGTTPRVGELLFGMP